MGINKIKNVKPIPLQYSVCRSLQKYLFQAYSIPNFVSNFFWEFELSLCATGKMMHSPFFAMFHWKSRSMHKTYYYVLLYIKAHLYNQLSLVFSKCLSSSTTFYIILPGYKKRLFATVCTLRHEQQTKFVFTSFSAFDVKLLPCLNPFENESGYKKKLNFLITDELHKIYKRIQRTESKKYQYIYFQRQQNKWDHVFENDEVHSTGFPFLSASGKNVWDRNETMFWLKMERKLRNHCVSI